MSFPLTQGTRRCCAFILQVRNPLKTLVKISELFAEREMNVTMIQMHLLETGDGIVTLHSELEKDRLRFMAIRLEKLQGVKALEWLEAKKRNSMY